MLMGLRPEHLVADDNGPIQIEIAMQEQLGANTLIHGALVGTDTEMVASLPGTQTFADGQIVRFSVPADTLHFFNTGTGRRIDATTLAP